MTRRTAVAGPLLLMLLMSAGCATVATASKPLVPSRHQVRAGPYLVATNEPIAADDPAVRQLRSLDAELEAALGLRVDPSGPPIEVYILDDRPAFDHFLRFYYPELPSRRAFFLAQGERRVVYAYRGERLEEDLRHEATHALLHAAVAALPLWLDEGLAEYFEVPPPGGGRNAEHLRRLPADVEAGWTPELARLEAFSDVRQMTPRDYREAWAWVHYLLNGPPEGKAHLLAYLADLRERPDQAEALSTRLADASGPMLAHLSRLRERPIAQAVDKGRETTVRLQDPEPAAARRRGVLGRIGRALGL